MKKILIFLLLIAIAATAYKFMGNATELEQLEYVPADTPILSAQLEPIDMQAYLSSMGFLPGQIEQALELLEVAQADQKNPAAIFFLTLLESYMEALKTPDEFGSLIGLKNDMRSMFYMVGVSPVMQIELESEDTFFEFISDAQKESGLTYSLESVDEKEYHRFLLDPEQDIELLVRAENNWVILTIHSPKFDKTHLLNSLAITKPAKNIVNSGVLENIRDDYDLRSSGIGFISTQQIGLAFTTKDGNSLARDIDFLAGDKLNDKLSQARSPECKADIDMLTAMWPGLFSDSKINTNANGDLSISSRSIIATTSKTAIDSLQAMRGFLPSYTTDGASTAFVRMGYGVDVANLSRSVSNMWSGMVNLELACEPLLEMQQELKQNNPTGAFAMAGVANGLMGMGAAINKLDMTKMEEGALLVDAIVSVSAEDVKALYSMIQSFAPMLGAITLPSDGEELNVNELFPMLDQFGVNVSLMATQSQLVLFSGDIAREQAKSTLNEKLSKNGLLSFAMDYKALFEQLMPVLEMSGEPIPPEVEAILETDMSVAIKTDVSDVGIELGAEITIKK